MTRFHKLEEFAKNFEKMDIEELRRWKNYWTQHAQFLAPKIRKQAMKRVYKIDKAVQLRLSGQDDIS